MMPGSALVSVYRDIFRLYDSGDTDGAKALFYRLQPYLIFALQHLEIAIHIEKRVLMRRGVFPSDRLREPTVHLDEDYQKQMDELVNYVIGLSEEVRKSSYSGD